MKHRVLLMLAVGLIAFGGTASAQLYGTLNDASDGTSILVEVDTDGSVREIGEVGYVVNGLAWDETTDTLYATTSWNDDTFPTGLLTIDLNTGDGTPVGTGAALPATSCGKNAVSLLAVSPGGTLYSWWEPCDDDLLVWNKAAGTAAFVGESGLDTAEHGLAFDNSGVLWLVNYEHDVYTINTTTGASTSQGTLEALPGSAHHGTFHPTANLYVGLTGADEDPRSLVVLNLDEMTVGAVVPTSPYLHTLAFIGPDFDIAAMGAALPADVPAVDPRGLLVLAAVLALAGVVAVKFR